jgi:hypothetical protein
MMVAEAMTTEDDLEQHIILLLPSKTKKAIRVCDSLLCDRQESLMNSLNPGETPIVMEILGWKA